MASPGTTNTSALVEIARGGPEGFAKLSLVNVGLLLLPSRYVVTEFAGHMGSMPRVSRCNMAEVN